MDVRTMRGADIDSDHFMIRMKYRTRLAAKKYNIKSDTKRWNLKKLREAGVGEKFEEAVASRLTEGRLDGGEVEEKWIVLKTVSEEAACEVIGKQKSPTREEWFDEKCMTTINKRNEARIRMLQCGTRNMKMEYARKKAAAKKITRKKKRLHDEDLLKEIELLSKKSAEVRNFYKKVNNKRNGYKAPAGICRDRSGKRVLMAPEQCLKEWTNYFEDLLNADMEMEENMSDLSTNQEDENNDDTPSLEEIIEAIGKIKRNKAAGIDDIPGELIKSGGMRMVTAIHDLVREVWRQETLPLEWRSAIICLIYKKGDRLECRNYRGISLLCTAYKILSKIIFNRMVPYAERVLGEYQGGFRHGRSTVDQIFTIRQILEKCHEQSIETHHLFVDYEKAYDSVNRNELWKAMREFGIPMKLIGMTRLTVQYTEGMVRIGGRLSPIFRINTGLRQGDLLSPMLFSLALEAVIRKVKVRTDGNIMNRSVQILAYADDLDIIGRSRGDIERMYEELRRESDRFGLRINSDKTKYLVTTAKNKSRVSRDLVCGDCTFEAVEKFKYLGTLVNKDNVISEEIKIRINQDNKAYFALLPIMRSRSVSRSTKIKIYKTDPSCYTIRM